MKAKLIVFSLLGLIEVCVGQFLENGKCDINIPLVENFDVNRFQGIWYEIESYPKAHQPGHCISHEFTLTGTRSYNLVTSSVFYKFQSISHGTVSMANGETTGRLTMTMKVNGTDFSFPYMILSTDYTSYALAYSCIDVEDGQREVWSWKLSRSNSLSQNASNAINQVISRVQVLNNRYYSIVDRSDAACFYYPEPSVGPVIFRGRCNQNISVVQNFDVAAYMGLWHDIESYPTSFQHGTCNNAFYTLRNGSVEVFNTQVINQTLDTITGEAVVAVTDGSAKLVVSFPIAGANRTTQTDYWVLATDYTSFSFVYSCTNLDAELRQVTSWKLSRTKQLTANANTAINNAMNPVDVLDQRYYLPRDQSPSGCFYFPEPQPGVPVVFPGQCDTNIPVVSNFNMSAFQGTWFEIQSYPSVQTPGQCVSHQFNAGTGNSLSLISSNVLNQALGVSNGTVAFTSANDTSARLTVTVTNNGTTMIFPLWILNTDYTSHALAYTCVNLNNDYRRVWSWKLSRTTQLTAGANTAINNAIANVEVLDNRYYQNVNHSAEACFYLPDIPPGQDVVFPGQCDPNIAAIPNFNASRYLGRWRLIESYPSDLQRGSCNEATYSLGLNGTVILYNTQVINQSLSTIQGSASVAALDGSGKLTVKFPTSPALADYWIINTDYDNYALIYSCANINSNQRRVWSWKMSRTNILTQNATAAINQAINRVNVLNNRYFQAVDRSDAACFYYPEPSSKPVIFRGQCDQNITVVKNFNASRYMGVWYDIQSYPTPIQGGSCNTAQYTLDAGGVVSVVNTQVVDQQLRTMSGSAVLASNDGSARLRVTFLVEGENVTSDYWVLATDYNSFAFVYSCQNIDAEYHQVNSWKLSRTTSLSTQAINVINDVIRSTPGLLEDYYQSNNHTEESCIYLPEVNPNQAPLFRGQCDNITQGVQNFIVGRFLGLWHEIERYPVDGVAGDCISSRYEHCGNQIFMVVDTSVLNGNATMVNASLVATSDGRLRRMSSSGEIEDIWVLATDYVTYALLYSCVNVDNQYKRIWSAKYSKARSLTEAAQNAMAPLINASRVLYPQFYLPVNQSDGACFHYPAQTGRQIIIPGQCDLNIPVVQSFNVTAYGGTWYQIEKYPQIHESGTCIGARYALNEAAGTVDVLNWEVINGTLVTIEGTAVPQYNDSSARLLVTLPVVRTNNTVTTSLYVVATDYVSYSLAYSCYNVNRFQRVIGAWKLSRTRTMGDLGTTTINSIINQREEFHQPYFTQIEHNADCPEPNSALIVKSSIIILLVCALLQLLM